MLPSVTIANIKRLNLKAAAKYLPFIVFVAVALLVGEEHPFSRFPMYSKFPEAIDYYYFVDEDNKPVSGLKEFSFTVSQLKDQMGAYLRKHEGIAQSEIIGASLILRNINPGAGLYFQKHHSLSIVRKNLKLEQGRIVETDTVLSTLKREHER